MTTTEGRCQSNKVSQVYATFSNSRGIIPLGSCWCVVRLSRLGVEVSMGDTIEKREVRKQGCLERRLKYCDGSDEASHVAEETTSSIEHETEVRTEMPKEASRKG